MTIRYIAHDGDEPRGCETYEEARRAAAVAIATNKLNNDPNGWEGSPESVAVSVVIDRGCRTGYPPELRHGADLIYLTEATDGMFSSLLHVAAPGGDEQVALAIAETAFGWLRNRQSGFDAAAASDIDVLEEIVRFMRFQSGGSKASE